MWFVDNVIYEGWVLWEMGDGPLRICVLLVGYQTPPSPPVISPKGDSTHQATNNWQKKPLVTDSAQDYFWKKTVCSFAKHLIIFISTALWMWRNIAFERLCPDVSASWLSVPLVHQVTGSIRQWTQNKSQDQWYGFKSTLVIHNLGHKEVIFFWQFKF